MLGGYLERRENIYSTTYVKSEIYIEIWRRIKFNRLGGLLPLAINNSKNNRCNDDVCWNIHSLPQISQSLSSTAAWARMGFMNHQIIESDCSTQSENSN